MTNRPWHLRAMLQTRIRNAEQRRQSLAKRASVAVCRADAIVKDLKGAGRPAVTAVMPINAIIDVRR